jgi:hypothetical protein
MWPARGRAAIALTNAGGADARTMLEETIATLASHDFR